MLRDENETITSNQNSFNSNVAHGSQSSCILMKNVGKGSNYNHKQAFSKAVKEYFSEKIDTSFFEENVAHIPKGYLYKDFIIFKINNFGEIIDLHLESKNKVLKDYFLKLMKSFPVVIPASSDGKFVNLLYGVPVIFKVR